MPRKRAWARVTEGSERCAGRTVSRRNERCLYAAWVARKCRETVDTKCLDGRDAVIRASVRCAGSITLILETRSHLDLPAIRDVSPPPPPGSFERPGYPFPLVAVQRHGFVSATRRRLLSFQRSRSSIFGYFGSFSWIFLEYSAGLKPREWPHSSFIGNGILTPFGSVIKGSRSGILEK